MIFGFNFLLGVLSASLVKLILGRLRKAGLVKKEYVNNFLMTRVGNFLFDVMVVAGIAAIRLRLPEMARAAMADHVSASLSFTSLTGQGAEQRVKIRFANGSERTFSAVAAPIVKVDKQ